MFQNFTVTSTPDQGPPRLADLRAQMDGLDAYLIPRADVHQGEYVAPCDDRLAWLTGFTGSAGFCVAMHKIAGVFIDGRYRLQVLDQVADAFTAVHWPETTLADWLKEQLPNGGIVGFDPWLHTAGQIKSLTKELADHRITLQATDNLVDRIWSDRPAAPSAKFTAHPLEFAGESSADKRARLAENLKGAQIITLPDSIAWLLNIRSTDIKRNPVPHAFAILHDDATVDLFARTGKADNITNHLGKDVRLHDAADFEARLKSLSGPINIDRNSCPQAVATILEGAEHAKDPCLLPKACKNETEIAGAKAAHIRDAVAMVRFLAWLDAQAPNGKLTEIDVVTQLETYRRETNQLRDISFETICGAGPNGAIVHYRVSDDTNRAVQINELLLVDSGGQYSDGTTDITRTIIVGTPSQTHIDCYTRVLQGMVALSRAQFPKGVAGQHLDALARFPLWSAGMDYDHGTGHGVGSYLSVHEGPQNLSRRSDVALQKGMILSNEPGYYRAGEFGIRIENLIVTVTAPEGPDKRDMLAFDTLTYVPLDRRLIDAAILSQAERGWIDRYHADTLSQIGPLVDGAVLDWLTSACDPL